MTPTKLCWYWKAGNTSGLIHAESRLQAKHLLLQHRIHGSTLRRLGERRKQLHRPHLGLWYEVLRQTADLLTSGLPLTDALTHSASEHRSRGLTWLVADCVQSIQRGDSLSQALSHYHHWLPASDIQTIAWAEHTGQLANALQQLHTLAARQRRLKKTLTKAVRYPLMVLCVAMAVALIMTTWVLPSFVPLFGDNELPVLTAGLITGAEFLRAYGSTLMVGFAGIVASLLLIRAKATSFWQQLLVRLPVVRVLLQDLKRQLLFHRLAVALNAGIDARQALRYTASSLTWLPHQKALKHIKHHIEAGTGWVDSFRLSSLNDPKTLSFLRVAEHNGHIGDAFSALAHVCEQRFEQRCERWVAYAEPLLMILLGGIIGTLLVAMYLPLFSLGRQF